MKPKIVDHGKVFDSDHWYIFYCGKCKTTIDCNIHPDACAKCKEPIEWPEQSPPHNGGPTMKYKGSGKAVMGFGF
jgi:hypothetical protein